MIGEDYGGALVTVVENLRFHAVESKADGYLHRLCGGLQNVIQMFFDQLLNGQGGGHSWCRQWSQERPGYDRHWDRLSIWVSRRNGGRPGLFCFRADSSELSDRGNFTVSSEPSLRTDRRAHPQKQTKTHRGNKPPAASRSAYNGPFYREGHRAFERR